MRRSRKRKYRQQGIPQKQGLYDPRFEHDACGTGFVARMTGERSHAIVDQALTVLENLHHRGAQGAEPNTGDGAGILLQLPDTFFRAWWSARGVDLPPFDAYGVGMVFLPRDDALRASYQSQLESIIRTEGQSVIGWRSVPVDNTALGQGALDSEPVMEQVFIARGPETTAGLPFERKLFVIRRLAEKQICAAARENETTFYFASLSTRTVIYKGMLLAEQVRDYFPDLTDSRVRSAIALVHSRFSTNTFPSWERAHPYRFLIHNGEINTIKGNANAMQARQAHFQSDRFGHDLAKVLPIIDHDGSDSAMFDNVIEFLTLDGRSLPHAVMMMVPEPWEKNSEILGPRRDFYDFHSAIMEPWDGPASMAFTDGSVVCAVLDRNGLRPSRYYVTDDDLVIMASEVGVLDILPEKVRQKGRLRPGRMLVVDTKAGRIISDDELKDSLASAAPYGDWLANHQLTLADLPPATPYDEPDSSTSMRRQQLFGYTFEDLRMILAPMAKNGIEAIGSMGDDSPISVLSQRPQLLYNYFRQLFAQVTNPPIDAIREELVTSTTMLLGSEGDLLNPRPSDARRIRLETPLLRNIELAQIREISVPGFQTAELPMLFAPGSGGPGLAAALDVLFAEADEAIAEGANLLVLSDRKVGPDAAPIPALLATSGLHQHLVRQGTRTQVSLIVESGEPRETHHYACLLGFGADAINPYLAFETMYDLIERRLLTDIDIHAAVKSYLKASVKGVVKILSKMGISTIQSYHGAQIFEALGLQSDFIDRYFTGTPSRIQGAGIDIVAKEAERRHLAAYPPRSANGHTLDVGGRYQFREEGEFHLFNPATVHRLQHAVRTGDYEAYKAYAATVNDRETHLATLRSLLKLDPNAPSIPLDEVEPEEAILRRFKTGAMSYGSISKEAHEALAIAMNRIGGKSNTGEGGEDTARFVPDENGDSRSSAIKQVASGRFGVTSYYLSNAKEIQIKMAQGAKPGEGGQLPGTKVYPWVAKVRYSTPGVGLISPPPHHDIYSIEDLAQLIYDLKNANPDARINVKLVSEVGVGTIAAGVAKGHADVILISGHDGGTGASPQSSIKHAGLPWELGLAETHQTLVMNNLRSRVRLETDGQLKTGRDVVIAALLGAEEFGFATSPLVAVGCIMMRVCHMDTCPVGIATQNPELRKRFTGDPQHVVNFMRFIARETRELMAQLGFRTMDEMIGRTDRLLVNQDVGHWKTGQIDLSPLLHQPEVGPDVGRICKIPQQHGLEHSLDETVLLDLCRPALEEGETVEATLPIRNIHRTVGTILGHHVTRRFGEVGLPEDSIMLTFQGSAGQSFGAFMPSGQTFILEGDANDYLGKGLSGGKIIVKPPSTATFVPEENIITGNVAFYGATSGEAYIRGEAGERFCVRNSGVSAVVEAVGDHGCEYMTGGRVAVLGPTGRNFAAGMSGGVAYVYDPDARFATRCNTDMVDLEQLSDDDTRELNNMIWRHAVYTGSTVAWHMLSDWDEVQMRFVKVMPRDYKRMLLALAEAEREGLTGDEQVMAAFEANRSNIARVGGN